MDKEINIPEQHKEIISSIISIEEIQTFLKLQDKVIQAEQAVAKAEKELADLANIKTEPTGPVPYYVTLTLISDVVIPPSDQTSAPEPVDNKSQSYVIEFIDKGYETLINKIYDKLTEVITEACKELIPNPKEQNNVDSTTKT